MSEDGSRKTEAEVTNGPFDAYAVVTAEMRIGNLPHLRPGDSIDVRFPHSWTVGIDPSFTKELQASNPGAPDYVNIGCDDGQVGFSIEITPADVLTGRPRSRHGRNIRARLAHGEVRAGGEVWFEFRGTRASRLAEEEEVYVAVNGDRLDRLPALVTLPGQEKTLRLIAPSSARPGRTFHLRIVSLDALFNLTRAWHRDVRIVDDRGRVMGDGIEFQGSTAVEILAEGPGVRRYRVGDAWSNPVKVSDRGHGPYWGDLHIHSRFSHDAIGRHPLRYARDVSCLDFAAVADHELSLTKEAWDIERRAVAEERREGEFEPLLAIESSAGHPDGHHNVYYYADDGRLLGNGEIAKLRDIVKELRPEEALLIPHHSGISWSKDLPAGQSSAVDFGMDDRGFRPAIEIYSQHGQSEMYDPCHFLSYEINRAHNEGRRVNFSVNGPFYARDAWRMGRRWAAIASSDDHWGQGGKPHHGLAAVYADALERRSILDAVSARSAYATTGERIILDLSVNGTAMGGVTRAAPGDSMEIVAEAHGTSPILWIELLCCEAKSGVYRTVRRECPMVLDHTMSVREVFDGDRFYYVRLAQKDLVEHRRPMAWSSPVWVETSASRKTTVVREPKP